MVSAPRVPSDDQKRDGNAQARGPAFPRGSRCVRRRGPRFSAPPRSRGAPRRGASGAWAGRRENLLGEEENPGMDLEGYAQSDLSKKLTSCQRSLKNLFKRSLSLTHPSHRPGVARQPGSTDPALSSCSGLAPRLPSVSERPTRPGPPTQARTAASPAGRRLPAPPPAV